MAGPPRSRSLPLPSLLLPPTLSGQLEGGDRQVQLIVRVQELALSYTEGSDLPAVANSESTVAKKYKA